MQNIYALFLNRKYRYIGVGIILGLCILSISRGCTLYTLPEINYRIGQDSHWPGLYLMGKERNLFAFNKDLLTFIAKEENFRFHLLNSANPIQELEKNLLQATLTTLQPSHLHENHLLFSHPYFLTGPVLIIPSHKSLNEWNENSKKIVGIEKSSSLISNLEQDPSIRIKFYEDILPALADLSEKYIDGAIFPAIPAYTYTQTFYKHRLRIATLPLTNEGIRLVSLKNPIGESLIKKFNQGLKLSKESGNYQKILESWDLANTEKIESE